MNPISEEKKLPVKLLIVDDEPDVFMLFQEHFRKEVENEQYELLFAPSGEAALKTIQNTPDIPLILSDINMPHMDGLTMLKKINELHEERKDDFIQKVIMITAYDSMEHIRESMNNRAFDFLVKPFDLKDLSVTIEKTLHEIDKINAYINDKKKFEYNIQTLTRYFSDDIVEKIINNDYQDLMRGENQWASIVYLDIRNFTAISETLKPHLVADLLNRIYPDLMELILGNHGSVNKLIGDAMVATFGLPIGTADDTYNAVKTATEIIDWLQMFQQVKPDYLGDHNINIGIGVTTGEVFAGNIGSYRRLEYTVIGDIVNTASRLQNLTKKVDVNILIDGETKKRVDEYLKTRRVRIKSIRGKSQKIEIFTVDRLAPKAVSDIDYF